MIHRLFTWALLLGSTALSFAGETADSAAVTPAETPSINMGWLFFKTMGILVLIIALIVVLVYLLKKYVFAGPAGSRNSGWIQVLAQTQIQPKKVVALVKVLDRLILVGMTESGMQTLLEFDDVSQVQHYLDKFENPPKNWSEGSFLGMMKRNLKS